MTNGICSQSLEWKRLATAFSGLVTVSLCGVPWQLLHMTNGMSGQSRNPAVVRFMNTGQGEGTVRSILSAERDYRQLEYITLVDTDKVRRGGDWGGVERFGTGGAVHVAGLIESVAVSNTG
jgi:hypothetical protein